MEYFAELSWYDCSMKFLLRAPVHRHASLLEMNDRVYRKMFMVCKRSFVVLRLLGNSSHVCVV